MIKTVIFDIGNVLMRFNWWEYVSRVYDYDTADAVTDAIWRRGLWNELDRGVMPLPELEEKFVAVHPEYRNEILQAFHGVEACMSRHEYAIPWIEDLKSQGYRVLFLSNYSEYLLGIKPEVLDFIPHMDGGVFSCKVHLIKPDPAIYQKICDTYDLVPAETLFIDDNAANIASAREFGLNAIHFLGYENTYPEICAFLESHKA